VAGLIVMSDGGQNAGKHHEPESLYRTERALSELTFGPDHLATANGLGNLARVLRAAGNHAAAEPLYRRACRIWSEVLSRRATKNRHCRYH